MFCCGPPLSDAELRSKQIDDDLKRHKKQTLKCPEIKLLLLGAGESGKSTIAKQMKILHLHGFSNEERITYAKLARANAVRGMKTLIKYAKIFNYELVPQAETAAKAIVMINPQDNTMTMEDARDIDLLWKDSSIQKTYLRSNEFQMNDTASYFFDNIKRISAPNYVPTDQDILNTRQVTCGITDVVFVYHNIHFRMVDVGGQRSQRRKWIQCFQGVHAVIFVTSLSEYDQKLYEDTETNRMHESLLLFDEICNNVWFKDTSIILFLNKTDLFQKKIQRSPLTIAFPEYTGNPSDPHEGMEYIFTQFLGRNRSTEREIYPHYTCATNTENIRFVFDAVKDIVVRANLAMNEIL